MTPAVIFDLGGVLIDWNPRHLYRKLFDDEAEMEDFLAQVCTQDWNQRQDAGRPVAEAVDELVAWHPERRDLIEAYYSRWPETMAGAIDDSVAILAELREQVYPLFVLSNFSAETFPHAQTRFDFLSWFEGIVISGEERVNKPDPKIYRILIERYGIALEHAVFIDDVAANVAAGRAAGLEALHFTSTSALRRQLEHLGLL